MAHERLRYINLYAGLVYNADHDDAFDTLLDNRGKKIQEQISDNYLLTPAEIVANPLVATMTVTIENVDGVSNNRPMYVDAPVDISMDVADTGTLTGNTLVANPGNARILVLTAEWAGMPHTSRTDYYGNSVNLYTDDGIMYRVFMGAEALLGTEAAPFGDLTTQTGLTGAIPLLAVRRIFGQTTPDEEYMWKWGAYVEISHTLIKTINRTVEGIQSNIPTAHFRAYWPGTDEDTSRVHEILSTAAIAGGKVYVPMAGSNYVYFIDGKIKTLDTVAVSTDPWISPDLDINSQYFLRLQLNDYGGLQFYVQKGTLPAAHGATYDAYPASLKGTPNAAAGGGFPSTSKDILLAIVNTAGNGTIPTVTRLYCGDFSYSVDIPYSHVGAAPYVNSIALPKPFSCDYDVNIRFGSGNIAPAAPTGNHKNFCPIYADISYMDYSNVVVRSLGKWFEENGASNYFRLPLTDPDARPNIIVTVKPKYRMVT